MRDDMVALRAARDWAATHPGHQSPDDRLLRAYGEALLKLAADELRQLADSSGNGTQAMTYEHAAGRVERFLD